jgi:NADH-quinone oxidoreductase subunit N
MPLPASPTILLAAAGLALITGGYLTVHVRRIWGLYFLMALLAAAYCLWIDAPVVGRDGRHVWNNDPFAISEQWLVLVFGLLSGIALFDTPRREQETSNTCGFLLFVIAGLMLVARSNDFLALGISLDIISLASMALRRDSRAPVEARPWRVTEECDRGEQRTARIWSGWLASGAMWLGIALLANLLATTQFDSLRLVLTESYEPGAEQGEIGTPSKLVLLAAGLIVMSLFARTGLVPFHLDWCAGTRYRSVGSSGFTMLLGQLTGSIALARLCGSVFVGLGQSLTVLMIVVSLTTFGVAGVAAVRGLSPGSRSVPRWLASMILLQSAWLVVGLMVLANELENPGIRWGAFPGHNESTGLFVFMQLAVVLAGGGICWSLAHLSRADRGIEFAEDLKGLRHFAPVAAFAMLISLASLVGLPLTAGYWTRWQLLLAGHNLHIKSNSSIFIPHAAVRFTILSGTVATLVVAGAIIRLVREMFFESPLARPAPLGGRGPLIAGAIAAAGTLAIGFAPQMILSPLRTIQAPRVMTPRIPQRGSGKNHSAFRRQSGFPRHYGRIINRGKIS